MAATVDVDNTREELRKLYVSDPEKSLVRTIVRGLADPVKPQNDKGRFRPHPVMVWLLAATLVAATAFLYFSSSQP